MLWVLLDIVCGIGVSISLIVKIYLDIVRGVDVYWISILLYALIGTILDVIQGVRLLWGSF